MASPDDPENIERARADIAVARAKHAEARAERAEAAVKLASEETERMRRAVEEFVARKEMEAKVELEGQKEVDFKVPEFIAQGIQHLEDQVEELTAALAEANAKLELSRASEASLSRELIVQRAKASARRNIPLPCPECHRIVREQPM